jgi:hypothetical protein
MNNINTNQDSNMPQFRIGTDDFKKLRDENGTS